MALSKDFEKLTTWAVIIVVIFAILMFGGVFIAKTHEVSTDIVDPFGNQSAPEGRNYANNVSDLAEGYFAASAELSDVTITVVGFVILAVLLVLLFYFIKYLKKGGEGKNDAGELL